MIVDGFRVVSRFTVCFSAGVVFCVCGLFVLGFRGYCPFLFFCFFLFFSCPGSMGVFNDMRTSNNGHSSRPPNRQRCALRGCPHLASSSSNYLLVVQGGAIVSWLPASQEALRNASRPCGYVPAPPSTTTLDTVLDNIVVLPLCLCRRGARRK